MSPPICFVAGPFSSKWGLLGIICNVLKMRAYTKKLLKLGVLPISPNVFYYWWYAQQPRKFWLESTEILARRCDIMFLIPGWKESTGAREENLSALRRHQPVYEDLGKVAEYVAKHTWPSL